MKSLLVDVLRQAGDGEAQEDQDAAAEPAISNLLTTTSVPLELAVDGEELPQTLQLDPTEPPAEQPSEAEPPPEPDKAVAIEPPRSVPAGSGRRSMIASVGRMAPLIALLCVGMSASCYALYQHLTAARLNLDLADVPRGRERLPESVTLPEPAPTAAPTVDSQVSLTPVAAPEVMPSTAVEAPQAPPAAPEKAVRPAPVEDPVFGLVHKAWAAARERNHALAERLYLSALASQPNHRDALLGLAGVLRATSRDAESIDLYERLLALEPNDTDAAAALLSIRAASDDVNVESELKSLLRRFPGAASLHLALGMHYARDSRWPEARGAFAAAHEIDPARAAYSFNLAVSLERLGHYDEARRYYEAALRSAGDNDGIDRRAVAERLSVMTADLRGSR